MFIILTWRTEATGKIVHHLRMDVKKGGEKKTKKQGVGAWEFGGVMEFGKEVQKQEVVILHSPNEHLNKTQYEWAARVTFY